MPMPEAELGHVTRWGKLPAWWLLHHGTDADRFAVVAALATYADDDGYCEPSQATLARRLGRSRPWVNRVIADLAAIGLLRKQARARSNGGTTSCRYQLAQTPEQAAAFAAGTVSEDGVPTVTRPRPAADMPCHRGDTSQADVEQTQYPRPDAREAVAEKKAEGDRCSTLSARDLPAEDWKPDPKTAERAKELCPDADLAGHTAHFVARCRAKGYRYAPGALGDAWLAWLLEDRRRDAQRRGGRDVGVLPSRRTQATSPVARADERFAAWASAAAAPVAAWT